MLNGAHAVLNDISTETYWRQQFPHLHIGERITRAYCEAILATPPPNTIALDTMRMKYDGYFDGRDDTLARLAPVVADAIRTCKKLGIPPTFVFLFDETWECFHALHHHLTPVLGNYVILPEFWAWHVDPKAGEAGWGAHRDKGRQALGPHGEPLSLTVWIPLSEATPLSSCIYVLPKSKDPVYNTPDEGTWQIDLPSIRALPGGPGEFFCWDSALLHWGSASSPFASQPRLSMALEVQRADVSPFNEPLLPAFCNVPFVWRLRLVAKQIMQYQHMYVVPPEFEALAKSLLNG